MRAHQILLARIETALRPYDLGFPTSSCCGCWRSALNEQDSRCRDVRARIADIGELRPGAGKAAAPPTRCGPKLRDALGICEHPLALKEPPQQ